MTPTETSDTDRRTRLGTVLLSVGLLLVVGGLIAVYGGNVSAYEDAGLTASVGVTHYGMYPGEYVALIGIVLAIIGGLAVAGGIVVRLTKR